MTTRAVPLRILNIGLDRALLESSGASEGQQRQLIYAENLPATIVHLVKAPSGVPAKPIFLAAGQVEVWPIPVRHWSLFPVAAMRIGARLMRQRQFDLIQTQEPFVSGLAGLWLARRFRLPLVVGAFSDQINNPGWLRESLLNRVANRVGTAVYRRAAAIRADSESLAQLLRIGGFPQAQHVPFLITNADSLAERVSMATPLRRSLLGDQSGPLLLAVVRLESEKNVPLMLRAMEDVSSKLPGVVLAIVGDGSLRSVLEQQAAGMRSGTVRWLGWVAYEDLRTYYQAADILLLSSNFESSARVLTEASLSGTPVLTTNTAGASEVIEDGVTGRVVPVGDRQAFAAALLEMCRDHEALKRMGREGQRRNSARVSRQAVVGGLRGLYDRVLDART